MKHEYMEGTSWRNLGGADATDKARSPSIANLGTGAGAPALSTPFIWPVSKVESSALVSGFVLNRAAKNALKML